MSGLRLERGKDRSFFLFFLEYSVLRLKVKMKKRKSGMSPSVVVRNSWPSEMVLAVRPNQFHFGTALFATWDPLRSPKTTSSFFW